MAREVLVETLREEDETVWETAEDFLDDVREAVEKIPKAHRAASFARLEYKDEYGYGDVPRTLVLVIGYNRPETPKEIAAREAAEAEDLRRADARNEAEARRREARERQVYEILKAKFEPPPAG